MLDKMKALLDMQKKMAQMKQGLEDTAFDTASPDGMVKITMSGTQEVKAVVIQADIKAIEKNRLEGALKEAYNKAIKHSHDLAAQKMKEVTGFNLPGLL